MEQKRALTREAVDTLRDTNLILKNKPHFSSPQRDREHRSPVFFNTDQKPRIYVQFFKTSPDKPVFLFNAILLREPSKGDIFSIDDNVYEVKNITRNLFHLKSNKVKEGNISVLVHLKEPITDS